MKITTLKPPSLDRVASVRRPTSRRRYQRARKAAMLGGRITWRAAKLGARAGRYRRAPKAAVLGGRMAWRAAKLGARAGRYRRAPKAAILGGRMAWRAGKLGARAARSRGRLRQNRGAVSPMAARASGMATGATIMYFLDPHAGRRRRHVARDRMLKQLRRSGRQASQRARYAAGVAEGKVHEATSGGQARPQPDDTTLARKVESEIFRDVDAPKGTINVNVEEGVVYLRGYTDSQEWIDRLIVDARAVEGVREVRSLLHVAQTS